MAMPELRLVRYWVAVAEEGNITRAASRLHVSQPALSAAVKQLEAQLGVALLDRSDRVLRLTPAGELLLGEGRMLLREAERVFDAVRSADRSAVGRLRIGMTPTARYGLGPVLLAACAEQAPGVMLYPAEDATGALLRDVRSGRLDLAIVFCAPSSYDGVVIEPLVSEPAVVHLRADHVLASRASVSLEELVGETLLVAESADSGGFTGRVLELCRARGFEPTTRPDPYPDLGLQAVREGLGVVVYVRGAFPAELPGSAFVPVSPPAGFAFSLVWRDAPRSGALDAVLAAIRAAAGQPDRDRAPRKSFSARSVDQNASSSHGSSSGR
jgi:DNA-binding transcriptional LysR family regulator